MEFWNYEATGLFSSNTALTILRHEIWTEHNYEETGLLLEPAINSWRFPNIKQPEIYPKLVVGYGIPKLHRVPKLLPYTSPLSIICWGFRTY